MQNDLEIDDSFYENVKYRIYEKTLDPKTSVIKRK